MINNTNRETCFANKDGKCVALTVGACIGAEACSFYKSHAQMARERVQVAERLSALPRERQEYIAETYYDNKMWWLKEVNA